MIKAVIFDFYSVFRPDLFEDFIQQAKNFSFDESGRVIDELNNYYLGISDINDLTDAIHIIFKSKEIKTTQLIMDKLTIPESFINLTHKLHTHFIKIGIAGNIGKQEIKFLNRFNEQNHQFDLIAGPLNYGELLLSQKFFEEYLYEIGEPPENCLLISGHRDYINFCKDLGMKTYIYDNFNELQLDIFNLLEIR